MLTDDEPHADNALLLRTAIVDSTVHAIVPALWLSEVGNTVARRFPEHAAAWLSALMKFSIEEVPPSQPWLSKCCGASVLAADPKTRQIERRSARVTMPIPKSVA